MKAQASIEFVLLIETIMIILGIVAIVWFFLTTSSSKAIINKSSIYYLTDFSFSINNTGIISGQLSFSTPLTISNVSLLFTSNSVSFRVPFTIQEFYTTSGVEIYAIENGKIPYLNFKNKLYTLKDIFFTENKTKSFISVNQTKSFN